jgi:hypothetical protein
MALDRSTTVIYTLPLVLSEFYLEIARFLPDDVIVLFEQLDSNRELETLRYWLAYCNLTALNDNLPIIRGKDAVATALTDEDIVPDFSSLVFFDEVADQLTRPPLDMSDLVQGNFSESETALMVVQLVDWMVNNGAYLAVIWSYTITAICIERSSKSQLHEKLGTLERELFGRSLPEGDLAPSDPLWSEVQHQRQAKRDHQRLLPWTNESVQ